MYYFGHFLLHVCCTAHPCKSRRDQSRSPEYGGMLSEEPVGTTSRRTYGGPLSPTHHKDHALEDPLALASAMRFRSCNILAVSRCINRLAKTASSTLPSGRNPGII